MQLRGIPHSGSGAAFVVTTNHPGIRDLLDLRPGEPVATTIHHQGLEYPGEVMVAPSWEASLGESLQGDFLP